MNLDEAIKSHYPEITDNDFIRTIILQDDSDGQGAYIAEWNYSKPLPDGMKVGKN
jgi:hypothetical protein